MRLPSAGRRAMVASQDPRACRQDESPSLAAFAPGLGGRCRLVAQPASGFARCRNPRCHAPVCHPQATGDLARLPACRAAVLAGQPAALPASGHQHGRARVALVGLDQRYILPRVQPGAAFPLNRLRHLGRRSRREPLALAALEPARIRAHFRTRFDSGCLAACKMLGRTSKVRRPSRRWQAAARLHRPASRRRRGSSLARRSTATALTSRA